MMNNFFYNVCVATVLCVSLSACQKKDQVPVPSTSTITEPGHAPSPASKDAVEADQSLVKPADRLKAAKTQEKRENNH